MGGRSIIVAGDPPRIQRFIWDKDKSDACLQERKFDFGYATEVWKDPDRVEVEAQSVVEPREMSTGMIDGKLYSVVTTQRGDDIRIISARRASKPEITRYEHEKELKHGSPNNNGGGI